MPLTSREIDDARVILAGFFGRNIGDKISINNRVIEVLGEMLTSTEQCSRLMDLIPRSGYIDSGYIKRQLRNIARRVQRNDGNYLICKKFIAAHWRREIEMASRGI